MLMNYFLIHLKNFLLSIVHTCYTSFFLPMPLLPLLLLKFMNTSAFIIKHWTILYLRKFINGTFRVYLVLLFCIWIYGWPLLEKKSDYLPLRCHDGLCFSQGWNLVGFLFSTFASQFLLSLSGIKFSCGQSHCYI